MLFFAWHTPCAYFTVLNSFWDTDEENPNFALTILSPFPPGVDADVLPFEVEAKRCNVQPFLGSIIHYTLDPGDAGRWDEGFANKTTGKQNNGTG